MVKQRPYKSVQCIRMCLTEQPPDMLCTVIVYTCSLMPCLHIASGEEIMMKVLYGWGGYIMFLFFI